MNKKTGIIIVVIAVVVVIVVAVLAMGNRGGTSQTQLPVAQTGSNGQTTQPGQPTSAPTGIYTSPDDGFSANFPGTPTVTKTQFNSLSAGNIPLTEYRVQSGSGSSTKYYSISVYHYPASYQFSSSYLSSAMRLFALAVGAKYPGAKLASQTPTQLLGNPAVSGVITVPVSMSKEPGYLIITVKGQNTYGIGTYGEDQGSYNAFVNSFTFTQ